MSRTQLNLTIDELRVPGEVPVEQSAFLAGLHASVIEQIAKSGMPNHAGAAFVDAGELKLDHTDASSAIAHSVAEALWC